MSDAPATDEALIREVVAFRDGLASISIATLNDLGEPESSYAPFVVDHHNNVFVFISGLAAHTANLENNPRAGLMFIEDESGAANAFARRRLQYQCHAEPVARDTDVWKAVMLLFEKRFGRFMETLQALPDFRLFRFVPYRGSYITGFGKTYRLAGERLTEVSPVVPNVK
jgi:putative heme iron utilization protein